MGYIYKITNDVNDKIYVGKTEFSIKKRFEEHCHNAFRARSEKRPLYAAMRKYGVEHFKIELIEETDTPEEREKYWISQLKTYTQGYNATMGGDGKRLYDHEAIASRLKEHPYPGDVAKEFGCCKDLVYDLGKKYGIQTKKCNEKPVSAYTRQGVFVKTFSSAMEAIRWCYEQGKCSNPSTGASSHIQKAAKGKRKTAYSYIWRYE